MAALDSDEQICGRSPTVMICAFPSIYPEEGWVIAPLSSFGRLTSSKVE
jgi:hypothetical protein